MHNYINDIITVLSAAVGSCCKVIQLFILLDTSLFIVVSSARFCYVGMKANSNEALGNQSCLTNTTHMTESLLTTDYLGSPSIRRYYQKMHNSSSNANKSPGQYCYIFRHILREILPSDVKKESVRTSFSCDFEDVCKGKETNRIIHDVVLKGEVGELYCCNDNNCNGVEKMSKTPAVNQICYNGWSNESNVVLDSCGHPDTLCITRTLTDNGKQVESYSCDNYKACDQLDWHGAINFCHRSQNGNTTEQLCCCVSNKCNLPSDPSVILPEDSSMPSTDSWKRVINPIANPNASSKDKSTTLVKGLVAAIVVVALIGILVLLVAAYRKRKGRDGSIRSDPNVIMQYERLSCSDASLEGSVSV